MRTFSGKVMLRLPEEVHRELAREAFETGRSINELCMEAILARKALRNYSPWESIEALWDKNRRVDTRRLTREIRRAISEVRRAA